MSNSFNLLLVIGIAMGLLLPITNMAHAFTSTNQDSMMLTNHSSTNDSTTSTSTVTSQLLQNSSILSAIKQFQESNEISLNRPLELTASLEQIRRPTHSGGGQRKMIRSRYRLRNKVDAPSISGFQTATQLSNYSQPLDSTQPPLLAASNLPVNQYQHKHQHYPEQQHSLARALTGSGVGVASIGDSSPHVSYATYLTSPSQREPVHHAIGESGSSNLVVDEPTSYNQESLLDYTPSHFHHQGYNLPPASGRMFSPTGRSQSMSNSATSASAISDLNSLPYFLGSPSMNSLDYYGSSNSDHQQSRGPDHDDHFVPRSMLSNFSSDHLNFEAPPYYSSSSSHSSHSPSLSDYMTHYGIPGSSAARNRWSWPWTDSSSLGVHPGGPMTAATFKKHYHHMPAQHKEHDHHHHHHEEHDHQLSKWEHGISIGEIACIAIAVVLGVIILGSPFFLLFLMLFNGGNLFGGTQMGLLAPTTAAAPAGAAGRRRRKRSVMSSTNTGNVASDGELSNEEATKANELDLHGIGEYLFERLSPFMEPEKLMHSFERIMNVKDDIESIVAGLTKAKRTKVDSMQSNGQNKANQQHVEMRKRRRK